MHSFALLVNPVNLAQLKSLWPPARVLPGRLSRYLGRRTRSTHVISLPPITSRKGSQVNGYLIVWPLLHEDMHTLPARSIIETIISAGMEAKKKGAGILGLCGYNSFVSEKIAELSKQMKISLTTGETLTAWSVIETIYRFAKLHSIDLKSARIAFAGAHHPVAVLCAKKLGPQISEVLLADEHADTLDTIKQSLIACGCGAVKTAHAPEAISSVLAEADFIVALPHSAYCRIKAVPFTKACFIANLTDMPLFEKAPAGVTVFTPGIMKLPTSPVDLRMGLPKNLVHACMAETILLALENKFITYASGTQINPDRLEDIADRAAQHGFEVWLPEAPVI